MRTFFTVIIENIILNDLLKGYGHQDAGPDIKVQWAA